MINMKLKTVCIVICLSFLYILFQHFNFIQISEAATRPCCLQSDSKDAYSTCPSSSACPAGYTGYQDVSCSTTNGHPNNETCYPPCGSGFTCNGYVTVAGGLGFAALTCPTYPGENDGTGNPVLCGPATNNGGIIGACCTIPTQTCANQVNGYCSDPSDFCTRRDFTYNNNSYTCNNSCCRPMQCSDLSDLNGACSNNFNVCPNGKTETYADAAVTNTCNTGLCCTTYQSCNGGTTGGTCNRNPPPANSCGFYGGSQSLIDTTYVHPLCGQANTSGNGYTCTPSTACNQQTVGSQSCTPNPAFTDNCNAGAGYTCVNQNTCVTSIFVHVYNQDTGAGMGGVTVSDNGGNTPQTDGSGSVTFTGKATGTYTISIFVPAGYQAAGPTSQQVTLTNNAGNQTVNFYVKALYTISGRSFYDQNHDTHYDGSDSAFGGGTVTVNGVGNFSVAGDGTWSTNQILTPGWYHVTYASSLPSGYSFMTANNFWVYVGQVNCNTGGSPDATCGNPNGQSVNNLNFGIDEPYQISGRVYNDKNKDSKYDNGEPGIGGGQVTISGPTNLGTISVDGGGFYTTNQVLLPGTYTVHYASSLPAGYYFQTANSWAVTVGTSCNKGTSLDATCGNPNSGSVNALNFGLTNETIWQQSACLDVRNDSGTYADLIPAAPSCGGVTGAYNIVTNGSCATGAGIVFTCTATGDFGLGSPNAQNWTAGGAGGNQECFTGAGLDVVRTSYSYLETTAQQSGITPIDLSTICTLTNCTLPSSLAPGVYQANSNVNLNAYTFPSGANPEAFIFLINGNLTINGNILIPAGSVAAFSTSGDINVAASVGNAVTNPADSSVNNPNIEGLYSADGNVVIHSFSETNGGQTCQASGAPYDNKLNIVGSVITNAALGGGSLTNNRDLCIYDTSCSSLSLGDNSGLATAYLLTLYENGQFLNHKLFSWQELKP